MYNGPKSQDKVKTNAGEGEECCDELREDDGRTTFDNKEKHNGDWGHHLPVREDESKEQKRIGDYHRRV